MIEGYDDDLEALIIQSHISTWSPEFCIAELHRKIIHSILLHIMGGVIVGLHQLRGLFQPKQFYHL